MHLPGNCGFSRLAATRQDQVTSATVTFMVSRLRGFEVCRSWWLYTVPLSKGWGRLSAAARSASGGERGKSYTQQLSWCHPVTRRQTGLISIYNSRLVICSSGSRPVSHQCSRFGAGNSSFLNVPTAVAHLDSRQTPRTDRKPATCFIFICLDSVWPQNFKYVRNIHLCQQGSGNISLSFVAFSSFFYTSYQPVKTSRIQDCKLKL